MSCPHGNHPDACDICDEVAAAYNSGVEHTKREWVGLTDDEKESLGCCYITTGQSAHNFIVAIEVALKVKNI